MKADTLARKLHDKATRGNTLTQAEQAALEAWYKRQDESEMAQLATPAPASPTLENLRAEVSEALRQLNEVTRRIQAQSDENEALRQENAALSGRLTQTTPAKAT